MDSGSHVFLHVLASSITADWALGRHLTQTPEAGLVQSDRFRNAWNWVTERIVELSVGLGSIRLTGE